MPKNYRILIIDSQPVYRRGLSSLIEAEPDLSVCGEAESIPDGRKAASILSPDIVLSDISFEGINSFELIRDLRLLFPKLPILILSSNDEPLYAPKVLNAGAKGYLSKFESAEKTIQSIRDVLEGKIVAGKEVVDKIMFRFTGGGTRKVVSSPSELLSDRELEVFQLIGKGFCRDKIAGSLNLSVKTIGTYRENIKRKLSIKTSPELVKQAVEWNIAPF